MYIKSVEIKNIKAIEHFRMDFPKPAGWHVLIGDNGAGKSTVVKAIALGILGLKASFAFRENWFDWIPLSQKAIKRNSKYRSGFISGNIIEIKDDDERLLKNNHNNFSYDFETIIKGSLENSRGGLAVNSADNYIFHDVFLKDKKGWFSAGFGPFRRFGNSDSDWDQLYDSNPLAANHMSLFSDKVALSKVETWLQKQYTIQLENNIKIGFLQKLFSFMNQDDFLPNGSKILEITSEGIHFIESDGTRIEYKGLSDGYRSVISLTLELIRQMTVVFKTDDLFEQNEKGEIYINKSGVVLIDEIDAHLHPTWQTRIGQWFTKYFPKIQFIVTTHSPLVCRAAENGSIWKLAAPGSEEESRQIQGDELNRLIFGNAVDQYGTQAFGFIPPSESAIKMREELASLSLKSFKGEITKKQMERMEELKTNFPT